MGKMLLAIAVCVFLVAAPMAHAAKPIFYDPLPSVAGKFMIRDGNAFYRGPPNNLNIHCAVARGDTNAPIEVVSYCGG